MARLSSLWFIYLIGVAPDMKVDLCALLPAGEWTNVQILHPPGMMAKKDWAEFAKAKRTRSGGKAAFIKFIVRAGDRAGDTTVTFTGESRLADMYARLQRLQQMDDQVPVVPLLELQNMESGLLIAMEEVTTLEDIIYRGEAYDLSAKVLGDLDPDTNGNGWLHLDVCPKNIGLLPNGRLVLIDVESLYLEVEGRYKISDPAWKRFRIPRQLEIDVLKQLASGGIERSVAARKLRFEIALAAAECVLGPIISGGKNLDRPTIEAWIANADAADPAVVFWSRELRAAIDTANIPPLQELRVKLESALTSSTETTGAPFVQASTGIASVEPIGTTIPATGPAPVQSGWLKDSALITPMAHALRAGRLGSAEIIEYRHTLEKLATQYPDQADVWDELLLIVISYEKNAALALSVVTEAHRNLPDNDDLARWKNIIQMWVKERNHGSHEED